MSFFFGYHLDVVDWANCGTHAAALAVIEVRAVGVPAIPGDASLWAGKSAEVAGGAGDM